MARFRAWAILFTAAAIACFAIGLPLAAATKEQPVRRGEIHFQPAANEATAVPKPFQLEARTFAFEQKPQASIADGVSLSLVTFPSAVETKYESNNTVHCEL